MSIKSFDD